MYEYFNSIEDYQKSVKDMKKENFFSNIEIKCPSDEEKERTKEINKKLNIKNEKKNTAIIEKRCFTTQMCI